MRGAGGRIGAIVDMPRGGGGYDGGVKEERPSEWEPRRAWGKDPPSSSRLEPESGAASKSYAAHFNVGTRA